MTVFMRSDDTNNAVWVKIKLLIREGFKTTYNFRPRDGATEQMEQDTKRKNEVPRLF